METIKNYLETMFQNLPLTPQVLRAKAELYSMMEDKYNESIREGHTENEAVGTVIAEFGNLEELAEDLGLDFTGNEPQDASFSRRILSFEEVCDCLDSCKITSLLTAVGVALCILCPVPVIFVDSLAPESTIVLGVVTMFLLVAAGVACLIYSGITSSKWDYIEKEYCMMDYSSALFVKDELAKFNGTYAVFLTVGITLCVLCAVPAIVIDSISTLFPFWSELSGAFVLIPVAVGVFMIIWAGIRKSRMDKMLKLNDRAGKVKTVTRNEKYATGGTSSHTASAIDAILSIYKPTVTCIYFIWSFLTFDWHITWIIWPISGVVKKILINIWGGKK